MPPQIARVATTEKRASLSHTAAGKRKSDSVILEDVLSGAPGRNRTRDLRFTKPLLYQLSYKGTNSG
jgi:hypothetical protein